MARSLHARKRTIPRRTKVKTGCVACDLVSNLINGLQPQDSGLRLEVSSVVTVLTLQ